MPTDSFLKSHRTSGHAGEVSWELDIDDGGDWIKPDIFQVGLLKMGDSIITSAPLAKFNGWIRHGPQQTTLNNVSGLISQYWGRQLAPQWWWISAQQFDQEDIAVEYMVVRSSIWGTRVQLPFEYIYLYQNGRREFSVPLSPAHVEGSPEQFQIEIFRIGKDKITLAGTGRDYGDFGDRIINTLTGDLEIRREIAL